MHKPIVLEKYSISPFYLMTLVGSLFLSRDAGTDCANLWPKVHAGLKPHMVDYNQFSWQKGSPKFQKKGEVLGVLF